MTNDTRLQESTRTNFADIVPRPEVPDNDPSVLMVSSEGILNRVIEETSRYDVSVCLANYEQRLATLNDEQRSV